MVRGHKQVFQEDSFEEAARGTGRGFWNQSGDFMCVPAYVCLCVLVCVCVHGCEDGNTLSMLKYRIMILLRRYTKEKKLN